MMEHRSSFCLFPLFHPSQAESIRTRLLFDRAQVSIFLIRCSSQPSLKREKCEHHALFYHYPIRCSSPSPVKPNLPSLPSSLIHTPRILCRVGLKSVWERAEAAWLLLLLQRSGYEVFEKQGAQGLDRRLIHSGKEATQCRAMRQLVPFEQGHERARERLEALIEVFEGALA